jgi:hypothetical protein
VKVFVSSVIRDFEAEREATANAARALGHSVIRSEDFGARVDSPQVSCLQGVRDADVVVLILGSRYGAVQATGMSATHEEFREARERKPVLLFVQADGEPEPTQKKFIEEARGWANGGTAASFRNPAQLAEAVTRGLHEYEVARAVGSVDPRELEERARATIPRSRSGYGSGPLLHVGVAAGPAQQIVRPADLESDRLYRDLAQLVQFGPVPVFDPERGAKRTMRDGALVVSQEERLLSVDGAGTVVLVQRAIDRSRDGFELAIIEEDLRDRIQRSLELTWLIYERLDSTGRITDVVPVAALLEAEHVGWQTRAEHAARPGSVGISFGSQAGGGVTITPAVVRRAALRHDPIRLAEDLTVLLRRQVKDR